MSKEKYRWDLDVNIVSLSKNDIEFSDINDGDLMRLVGFATHEGINSNGTKFRREILQKDFSSLLNKPLRILTDYFNRPTGHGFNRNTKKFSKDILNIGHITKVVPVLVDENDQILCEVNNLEEDLPDGNYRLLFEAVLYKEYYNEISEVLVNLHESKQLKFSIEANINYELAENDIKDCTSIKFTGLSIVKNPAFEKAFSILVAEEERKELNNLDYEKLYNEMKIEYEGLLAEKEILISEKEALISEKETLGQSIKEISEKNETLEAEIIVKNTEISGYAVEIAELNSFKEKFETSEKEKMGEDRLVQIKELCETELTSKELAEMTDLEFSNVQVECAKKLIETAQKLSSVNFSTKLNKENASDTLRKILLGE